MFIIVIELINLFPNVCIMLRASYNALLNYPLIKAFTFGKASMFV